jgi:hypothetical protein
VTDLLRIETKFAIAHLVISTYFPFEKKNTSLSLGCCSHHEVAVADTANQLLEEIPRLQYPRKHPTKRKKLAHKPQIALEIRKKTFP